MAKVYTGTIAGTGAPTGMPELSGSRLLLSLDFAGTATVKLQVKADDVNWVDWKSYTADAVEAIDFKVNTPFRLYCSAHTNNVVWAVRV
jgi:hypothetical protein